MKNILKNTGIALLMVFGVAQIANAQVTLDCESGNRGIEQAACWGFGATSYNNTAGLLISGKWSVRTNSLTNLSLGACWVKSPWMTIKGQSVSLKARLDGAGNGVTVKNIVLSYIAYDANASYGEGASVQFHSFSFTNFYSKAVYDINAQLPSEIVNNGKPYKILVSFVGTGGNERAYADDFVFDAKYASDPTNNCLPIIENPDADGDGVVDAEDAFPKDKFKAYTVHFPQSGYNTLAFEDNWPFTSDYDMNDLVVDYGMDFDLNAKNEIVEINGKVILKAAGANNKNGFGFMFDGIPADAVFSAEGSKLSEKVAELLESGVEANQKFATYLMFNNSFDILPQSGAGIGVNTSLNGTYHEPVEMPFKMVLQKEGSTANGSPVYFKELIANSKFFNPFMIKQGVREQEIHLPDYMPTLLQNTKLFGEGNDRTNVDKGYTYKTERGLPWAIQLPKGFDYPIEGKDGMISKAYNYFVPWAESGGEKYNDWWSNSDGYRNEKLIYQKR